VEESAMQIDLGVIERLRSAIGRDIDDAAAALWPGLALPPVEEPIRYVHLTGLQRFVLSGVWVFCRDRHVALFHADVAQNALAFTLDDLSAALGPAQEFESAAGKLFRNHVRPAAGLAVTAENGVPRYIEVFSPRSIDAYQADFGRPVIKPRR
jgi:hypothetical protein